ncbi:MAG: hypothetical protein LBG43_05145 [Treponema sp.]|jgi:FkbM family methyltransferase|nr:hypothetical protein [Treponema sp.]
MPFLSERFEKSIFENGYKNIRPYKFALSNGDGAFEMAYQPNAKNAEGSFLNTSHEKLQAHTTITVKTVALDSLNFEKPAAFHKMDADGRGTRSWRAANLFFKTMRPKILMEAHPCQLKRVSNVSANGFINHLNEIGYDCYAVSDPKK